MIGSTFFLTKRTDTHADALAAAGLGHLLAHVGMGNGHRRTVTLRDEGPCYSAEVSPALGEDDLERWDGKDLFYRYIKLKGDDAAPPGAYDYDAESAILLEARKAKQSRAAQKKGAKRTAPIADAETAALQEAATAPDPEIAFLRTFNGMRKGFMGDIDLHRALRDAPPRDALRARLGAMTHRDAYQTDDATPPIAMPLTASQWFLPLAGKGISRVKADGTAPGQFPGKHLDWFETWLRYIGMYRAMTSHGVGDDLKLAVIAPADFDEELLLELRDALRSASIFGGKIDVRAPLTLARALVERSEEHLGQGGAPTRFRFKGRTPKKIIRGLYVTTYKKMGTAHSVFNLAFLGIPSWGAIKDHASAEAFLAALKDLDSYQAVLRDNISDDIETLRVMRDFVSAGTLETALAFFARVAVDVMKRLGAKKYAALLSIETVRRILMGITEDASKDDQIVGRIIQDDGFLRFAKAIRAATIHAQLHEDAVLQPRYGLAQTWRQHAPDKARFVEAIAEFAQQFNADVVRQREVDRGKGRERKNYPGLLMTDDSTAVMRLIEASSSRLVAHLLLAYGFAQVPKKAQAPTGDAGSTPQEDE